MKIALLGDCHLGMRKDSPKFHKHAEKFFSKIFFPYLEKHKIDNVLQLGDLFDNRKSINPYTVDESKRYFFSHFKNTEYKKTPLRLYTLLGNHDIYWRESLKVNTPTSVLGSEYNIQIIDEPTTLHFGSVYIDFVPWICTENSAECEEFIKKSSSPYCMGHFEIFGFQMYKGTESHGGISEEIFRDYTRVFSGHFHTQSMRENIQYIGTPYEITWEDYNDPRGFHILDTETGHVDFIQNPYTMFSLVEYNGTGSDIDEDEISEKIVKVIVKNKSNLYDFEHFLAKINIAGTYDVKIIETDTNITGGEIEETINLADTMSILNSYIDSIDIPNKKEVKHYLKALYTEALNNEVV